MYITCLHKYILNLMQSYLILHRQISDISRVGMNNLKSKYIKYIIYDEYIMSYLNLNLYFDVGNITIDYISVIRYPTSLKVKITLNI